MKKYYNIFRLYVVHVERNNSIHHLICSYNRYTNLYTDIFTKSKIKVIDEATVEPLYIYYPVLGVANYTTGEPLMLSKEALLKKYKELNEEKNLEPKHIERKSTIEQIKNKVLKRVLNKS